MTEIVRHLKRDTLYRVVRRGHIFPPAVSRRDGDGIVCVIPEIQAGDLLLGIQVSRPDDLTDDTPWVIYASISGDRRFWARPEPEFDDGRFEPALLDYLVPSAALREIADRLETGRYGKQIDCVGVVILAEDGIVPFGLGPESSAGAVAGLLRQGADEIDDMCEGEEPSGEADQ